MQQRLLILSVCLIQFFCPFMGNSLNIAVPALSSEYATSPENITWVMNVYMIATASFLLPATALANFFGYRNLYFSGCLLASAATLAVPLSPTFSILLFARVMQGICLSMVFCSSMALLVDKINKEKRATAIGFAVGAVYAGLSLSPLIAGVIADSLGWRSIFFVTVIGLFTAGILVRKVLKDLPNSRHFNLPKMSLCFLGIALILLSFSIASYHIPALILVICGIAFLSAYLVFESRSRHPVFPIGLVIGNKTLTLALGASAFNYMSNFSISLLLALHMQFILGFSASHTGVFLVIQPAIMMVLSSCAGKIAKYMNAHTSGSIGMILIFSALVLLHFLHPESSLYHMIICQIIAGIGFGLFSAPNTTIVMSSVKREQLALASALQAITRTVGMACCMAILTTILNSYIDTPHGTKLYTHELSNAISFSFMISALIAIIGCAFCFAGLIYIKKKNNVVI